MKHIKVLASLAMVAMLALSPMCTSLSMAAEEPAPGNDSEIREIYVIEEVIAGEADGQESDIDTEEALGGANTSGKAEPMFETNVSGSYQAISNNQTIMVRGLDANNSQDTIDTIREYAGYVINDGKSVRINDPSFIDAEKYSKESGYDSQLCWAATAANILWTTGYAQQAINPLTGTYFANVDEVLTYFSENFTDNVGAPTEAVNWFINGKYTFNGQDGLAQQKTSGSGGLLADVDLSGRTFLTNMVGKAASSMAVIENIGSYGMGVLVRWLDSATNQLSSGAHWMTIVGAILDETKETSDAARYQAIIIANSDDKVVEGDLSASTADKLSAKIAQPNNYVVYKLTYNETLKAWTIDGFSDKTTVITYIYGLMDNDKNPEGEDDEDTVDITDLVNSSTEEFEDLIDSEEVTNSSDTNTAEEEQQSEQEDMSKWTAPDENTVYVFVPKTDVSTNESEELVGTQVSGDINQFRVYNTAQLEQPAVMTRLYNYMKSNNVAMFSLTYGPVNVGDSYEVYLPTDETLVYSLQTDEVEIPFDMYEVSSPITGMTKVTINPAYLSGLSKGPHYLHIFVQGQDKPVEIKLTIE